MPCVFAGQSVVQMAQCARTQSEYAMKFFVNQEDFEDERSMYLRSDGTISEHLAADLKLPRHHIILDNQEQRLKDRDRNVLPPCIVIERGESLDLWSQRARPCPLIAFAVRPLAASHTGICGMHPFLILCIVSNYFSLARVLLRVRVCEARVCEAREASGGACCTRMEGGFHLDENTPVGHQGGSKALEGPT